MKENSHTHTIHHFALLAWRVKGSVRNTLLALAACSFCAMGQAADFTYTTNGGKITITGYTGPGGAVVIPGTITELPVAAIGYQAFLRCTNVTSVSIPTSVTTIGAFAFNGCTGLSTVTIPSGVTSIGDRAFGQCDKLTAIDVDPANTAYSSIEGVVFNRVRSLLVTFPCGKSGNYTVPESVTQIGSSAFSTCYNLTGIRLPVGLTSIGMNAFYYCDSLKEITIPSGVEEIGMWTFAYNLNLTNLTILGSITNFGNWAFYDANLKRLVIPDGVVSIGWGAFSGNYFMTNVIIGRGIKSVGDSAFAGNVQLSRVYFRGDAPTAGTNVFEHVQQGTVYYLPGTTGWEPTFAGLPTALWLPEVLTGDGNFGVKAEQFGFTISWTDGMKVAIDACANLGVPAWTPLKTNTVPSGGTLYFSDPNWGSYPSRAYRVRWP